MRVLNLNDHMAKLCECGCVRFNLLRSGSIECDDCGERQPNLTWREAVDHNYKPKSLEAKPTATEIDLARQIIRAAITNSQQCFAPQINKENNGKVSHDAISAATNVMIKGGELRLKEDFYEHDWEYILR